MEKQLREIQMEIMQDRLDSLESRFEELANSFAHVSAKQLSKQCISCMEAIRNLASDCLIANTDQYLPCFDRTEFIRYAQESRQAMRFTVDENNTIQRIYREAGHHRQMTEEERHDRFLSLKAGVPSAKLCFPPFNAHELFVELAINLENLTIRELEFHDQPYVPDDAAISQPPPPYESQGRGYQHQDGPHPMAATMPRVEDSFSSGASFESIATDMSGDEESKEDHFKRWSQLQLSAYGKYLKLPVTPHVISEVLSHYENAQVERLALPLGLKLYRLYFVEGRPGGVVWKSVIPDLDADGDSISPFEEGDIEILTTTRDRLRDDNWDSGAVLETEVPPPHPLLPHCMVAMESLKPEELSEFGLVVAWRYYGTQPWMDRCGHLVPDV
ncbi:uncharacterized protein FMAN_11985 [Fusarium mangiferae]|uniref:Uncharacterized protein n=1 Tax=Fusarium mangiferae TaxID=192010 RepID=A0A1L7UH98_FUSMA|nr:uncharacterized protein FMAN_11985 [Fusarium mangiferae]CVL06891.1 uncharacterized protein FMAN_11985 [Fusarium mangiferae]